VHVAERQVGPGLEQLRRGIARQVAAGLARQQPGPVGVARLQRDEAVGQGGEAEILAAFARAAGEVERGADDALGEAPDRRSRAPPRPPR
jgi:hypothetical protein